MSLLDAALVLRDVGCSVVPVVTDGSKMPAVAWKSNQTTPADTGQLSRWFNSGTYDGLGVICGAVSGSLEMLEVEGRALHLVAQLAELMSDNGFAGLWARLSAGHLEQSPSGGMHWLYRVDGETRRNTKLARRPATSDELAKKPDEKVKVLIETRGEGGFTVVAPSAGRTHPSGKPWQVLCGGPQSIPTISADERDALYAIATMLDEMPAEQPAERGAPDLVSTGARPGDDYNARAAWEDILTPHGWQRTKTFGSRGYGWTRPGKHKREGISATTGTSTDGADRLYVFSTSTELPTETPLTKFAAYTLLEHRSDYSAAASALRTAGYGAPPEPARPLTLVHSTDAPTDGSNALQPQPASTLERSEDGHAHQVIDTYGDLIRYCPQRGRWLTWTGALWQWEPSGGGTVREHAKDIARSFPSDDQPAITWKKKALSSAGITGCLTQAATDPRVVVAYDDLDADPWALNTPGGIVDLRTGKLRPAQPADLCTRITCTTPDPSADDITWRSFLADTFGDDTETIDFLQRLVGYSAIGYVGPHVLPFCHGSGGNGKGVFLEAITRVLGDYATAAPVGFLMARVHAAHETEIARLAGARMVLCSEVNESDRFDEAKVKQLTGGDSITARFMKQDHFTFTPTHQLWLMGNAEPGVRTGGDAFWRRLRKISFEHKVPDDKIIDDLQGLLARDHGPALMAWIVAGAVAYARTGLAAPEKVLAATAGYAHDQDTVERFLEDMCHLVDNEDVSTPVGAVRGAYEKWCNSEGEEPVTGKALGIALQRRGIESKKKSRGIRHYTGLMLLSTDDDAPPDPPNAPPSHGGASTFDWNQAYR